MESRPQSGAGHVSNTNAPTVMHTHLLEVEAGLKRASQVTHDKRSMDFENAILTQASKRSTQQVSLATQQPTVVYRSVEVTLLVLAMY